MEKDEDIMFEEITVQTQKRPQIILEEKEYSSLYEELKDKCDPDNFLPPNPYDREKAGIANDIYLQLDNAYCSKKLQKTLRSMAISQLGIRFNSHALCDKLKDYTNPKKYKGTEKFGLANELYADVLDNKDDVEALEKIQSIIESELLNNTIEEIERQERERQEIEKKEKESEQAAIIMWLFVCIIVVSVVAFLLNN
ncbi:MAG: hypothetical protein LBP63_01480 [Prevotellaceae bacterium]|jgi:hypothetical protein|nr:hypothetical protein [Prevotellaceae bacterium]